MGKLIFEINKPERDTVEVEFKERFEITVPEKGNKIILRERNEWKSEEDVFYKEIPEKNLPEILHAALVEKGIDSYTYDPHPLIMGRRLCISSENLMDDLNNAVDNVKSKLDELQKLFKKELK